MSHMLLKSMDFTISVTGMWKSLLEIESYIVWS